MTYEEFKAQQKVIETAMKPFSDYLNAQPKGPMGLTPDEVKSTPEWKRNYNSFHCIAGQYRKLNAYGAKMFKVEIRKERLERLNKFAAA